ncbi:hypothetical protein ABXN37_25970 [Piscinibacter sakaiensis]|uniref:Peptidase C58 YopT-type domain-containing protein n=1 Tax=Piscinibacter sakaiensis TaxID=1547922 RepID=A0A0K8P8P7_PISS1|nr:hypothetical protein [Piscinibacter sakaiensis]GAP38565.1 hypothetical protein ISF6_5023 [Piscinibacter sakaiensis]
MSLVKEMLALGATLRGREFNQGKFSESLGTLDGVSIGNGYCAGVVLDWTRRVLQSSVARDAAYLSYESPAGDADGGTPAATGRQAAALLRMVDAFDGQASSYVERTDAQQLVDDLRRLAGQPVAAHAGLGSGVPVSTAIARRMAGFWAIPGVPDGLFSRFRLDRDPAGVLDKEQLLTLARALVARIKAEGDPQKRRLDRRGRHWGAYATELDTKFATIRALENRGVSKKPFSGIRVVGHRPLTAFASPGDWLRELLDIVAAQPGSCTVVNLKRSLSEGGHAVAIQHGLDSRFYLFDPNGGTFACSLRTLARCLTQLFWTSCLRPNPYSTRQGELAYYERTTGTERVADPARERTGWKAMACTVFMKA